MSNYLYLVCEAHDPPLRADCESGQHLYDLPQIREDIRNRDIITAAMDLGMEPASEGHFFRHSTARFLQAHPLCLIAIIDEDGKRHPLEDPPEGAEQ